MGRRTIALVPVAAVAGVAAWLAWRSLGWPLVHDAPVMHYIAWRIAEGAVPYRDIFDMNFPGVYLFHLTVVRTLGVGDAAWRAVDLALTAATAVMVAALAAPWGRVAALGGALFFAAYHLAGGAWNAGQRDVVLCPLLLGGALGVARWAEGDGAWPVFAGGVALGAGLTIKPHALILVLALAMFVLVRSRAIGVPAWRPVGALVAGVALAPAAAVTWVAALGGLGAWREIVFGYLVPLYSRLSRPADWLSFRWHLWVAILATLALTLARLAWNREATARHAIVMLGLGYGLVHFVVQRKGWEYHLYPLAAFAAVLLFAGLERARGNRRPLAFASLVAGLVAVAWLLGAKGAEAADSDWILAKERRVTALVDDLAARSAPGDRVHVFDTTEGGVHALLRARRVQPTRFIYDFHFFHHTETAMVQRLRADLLRELRDKRPVLVVLWEAGWPAGGYERLDGFSVLKAWLTAGYEMARQGDGYRIYAKRHDS